MEHGGLIDANQLLSTPFYSRRLSLTLSLCVCVSLLKATLFDG